VHAHDDRPEDLLAEAERLAPQLHDPDFDGFVELVRLALPLLAAERKAESPELYAKTRELCDLRYRQARRELVHEQADEETLAKEGARIAELEKEIGAAVRQRYGLPPQDPEAQRALKALGYIDSDGK